MRRLALLLALGALDCGGRVALAPGEVVAKVTGRTHADDGCPSALQLPSTNDTASRWAVVGTDLGITWDTGRGEIAIIFGDTFENLAQTGERRRNVIGFSSERDPGKGLTIARMIEDAPGHAREVLSASHDVAHEESVIPTAGVAIGGRQYLFFTSVARWAAKGRWSTNYSSVALSDDGGATWARTPLRFAGSDGRADPATGGGFAMVGVVHESPWLWVLGTNAGRFGSMHLARVAEDRVLEPSAWAYLAEGGAWVSGDETAAAPILEGPIGELSVRWNAAHGAYRLTYLDEESGAVVERRATALAGPWSPARVLFDAASPATEKVYGGFQHPWWSDAGEDVWLTLSRNAKGRCYDVFLARAP